MTLHIRGGRALPFPDSLNEQAYIPTAFDLRGVL